MKYIYIILGILVIGGGIYLGMNNTGTDLDKNENMNEDTSSMEDTMDMTSSTDENALMLLPEVSSVKWTGKKVVLSNWIDEGSIQAMDGSLSLAEDNSISSGFVTINMNSITASKTGKGSGESMLAKHLASPDFFDAEKYPTARFDIKGSTVNEDKTINLSGDLTIKGITKPYVIKNLTISNMSNEVKLSGKTEIDRSEFEVKFGSDKFFKNLGDKLISDKFNLDFNLIFSKTEMMDSSKDNSESQN